MGQAFHETPLANETPMATSSRRLGAYLRRLREGYGYTLRKVEERSGTFGESIDNSQLSRFEKGKAVPSFEKLRALARVFNVSVQNFSDILDLEEYSRDTRLEGDFEYLVARGRERFGRGEYGHAVIAFEQALEHSESSGDTNSAARARLYMAASLKCLGKLSLTEAELRTILKTRRELSDGIILRCLLELTQVYRQFGDYYLAGVFARECLEIAERSSENRIRASVLNTLGSILHDEGEYEDALPLFEEAVEAIRKDSAYPKLEIAHRINLGGCQASLGHFEKAQHELQAAFAIAGDHSFRRLMALARTRIGEALFLAGKFAAVESPLAESDALVCAGSQTYDDIMFMNTFLRWKIARIESHGTKEKIAFGRLRHLRTQLERKFPEVLEFDRYVETHRRNHHV